MKPNRVIAVWVAMTLATALTAQTGRQTDVPLKHWPAPLYWQPEPVDNRLTPHATTPVGALVFVGMTPCRLADTRSFAGFTGAFGPPAMVGGGNRSFPLQSSTTCSIPAIAQAYSLNITVLPSGPSNPAYLTIYPTGQPVPLVSTLNYPVGFTVANAAIVPAGTPNGSVSVYVSNSTDMIIDINGYYAPQSGITLAQGSAGAPSLSFSGDAGTGIFSSGAGVLNLATGGTNRLTVRPDGDLDLAGNIRKGGTLFLHNLSGFGSNTAVGLGALQANTAGNNNTASGYNALVNNTIGNFNTANGIGALNTNTTGSTNTASGSHALYYNTTGNNNTASGSDALVNNTEGDRNTASGVQALANNFGGSYNTAIGYQALLTNSEGIGNIAVGHLAGSSVTLDNNIDIGNAGSSGDIARIRIGTAGTHNSFFAAGIVNSQTGQPNAVSVLIDSNGQMGTINSSRRYKEDIHDMGDASGGLLRLRPVTFRYQQPYADGSKPVDYGLIAEEVAEVYPDLVVKGAGGEIETVQYQKLTPMLLNELQKEHQTIRELQEQNRRQAEEFQSQIAALQKTVQALVSAKNHDVAPEQ